VALAVSKYWVCKRAIAVVAEALECHGGNGYVEESILPRLHREAPLNSIWEGSGNVNALDVLRAMTREPESIAAFVAEVELAKGADARLDRAVADLKGELANAADAETRARRVVEHMAIVLQGSLLVRHGDPAVTAAFSASRVGGDWGHSLGTLPAGTEFASIVERHRPATN
jgi:putative acyl-CoA dehydrogenase